MTTDRRFAQLVREHAGAVVAYARAVAPELWTADHAVQETFLRAWKYRDGFRATRSFELMAELPERGETTEGGCELYDVLRRLPLHRAKWSQCAGSSATTTPARRTIARGLDQPYKAVPA